MKRATISAREWNATLDAFARSQILSAWGREDDGYRHPWFTTAQWSGIEQRWEATVKPGFVNGLEVTTADRPLTESPAIPLTAWRAIGSDAGATSATLDGATGELTFSFEAVPEFFLALGVKAKEVTSTSLDNPQILNILGASDQPTRRLRACDLVLSHDRPGLTTVGVENQVTVGFITVPGARDHAYLSATRQFAPVADPDPLQQLAGNWSDTTRDSVLVATVFMLSPADAAIDAVPDATWTPYVKHELFWDLMYAHTGIPPSLNANPLTLQTGLLAGVADTAILARIDDLNQQARAAYDFLSTNRITGKFWSV